LGGRGLQGAGGLYDIETTASAMSLHVALGDGRGLGRKE
jgi:hypothetical protein